MDNTKAYEAAGYKPHRSNASRMIADDSIKTRIGELQDEYAVQATKTVEQHLARLTAMSEAALKASNYGAAVRAEELIGKVLGLYVERFKQEDAMTDAQLAAQLGELLAPSLGCRPDQAMDRITALLSGDLDA